MGTEPKRKITLVRSAIAGAACTLVAGLFASPPLSGNLAYWFGYALGGALLFVGISALLNIWRR